MDAPQADPPKPQQSSPPKGSSIHRVPRRFDLATMFVVTSAYAIFFGIMTAVGAPAEFQAAIIGFLTFVGLVQMVVPERYVRLAAVICGLVTYGGLAIAFTAFEGSRTSPGNLVVTLFCSVLIWGVGLGYVSGVIVAGLFLISHHIRNALNRGQDSEKRGG